MLVRDMKSKLVKKQKNKTKVFEVVIGNIALSM